MPDLQQILRRAQVHGRIPSPERAQRWLRATTSLLADWGGEPARTALKSALPPELLRSVRGLDWQAALAEAEGDERVALLSEAGRRAGEPDPGKVSWSLKACLHLIREQLGPDAGPALARSLPEGIGQALLDARWDPPWRYRLVPQPFGAGRRAQRELRTGSALVKDR